MSYEIRRSIGDSKCFGESETRVGFELWAEITECNGLPALRIYCIYPAEHITFAPNLSSEELQKILTWAHQTF